MTKTYVKPHTRKVRRKHWEIKKKQQDIGFTFITGKYYSDKFVNQKFYAYIDPNLGNTVEINTANIDKTALKPFKKEVKKVIPELEKLLGVKFDEIVFE